MTHEFTPDPAIPTVCALEDCQMPRPNRVHIPGVGAIGPLADTVAPIGERTTVTQLQAALKAGRRSSTVKAAILDAIAEIDPDYGMTDAELFEHPRVAAGPNTARPRRIDLCREGWLRALRIDGKEATRNGSTVWVLTSTGRVAWHAANRVSA